MCSICQFLVGFDFLGGMLPYFWNCILSFPNEYLSHLSIFSITFPRTIFKNLNKISFPGLFRNPCFHFWMHTVWNFSYRICVFSNPLLPLDPQRISNREQYELANTTNMPYADPSPSDDSFIDGLTVSQITILSCHSTLVAGHSLLRCYSSCGENDVARYFPFGTATGRGPDFGSNLGMVQRTVRRVCLVSPRNVAPDLFSVFFGFFILKKLNVFFLFFCVWFLCVFFCFLFILNRVCVCYRRLWNRLLSAQWWWSKDVRARR